MGVEEVMGADIPSLDSIRCGKVKGGTLLWKSGGYVHDVRW